MKKILNKCFGFFRSLNFILIVSSRFVDRFRTVSIGNISSARERCIVRQSAGDYTILELVIEPVKLGVLRVYRHGARDSQRVVEAGASVHRIETIENLCHLLRSSYLVASGIRDDLDSGPGCFQRSHAGFQRDLIGQIVSSKQECYFVIDPSNYTIVS